MTTERFSWWAEGAYGGVLTTDSVVSLGRQGGALSEEGPRRSGPGPGRRTRWRCAGPTTGGRCRDSRVAGLAPWIPLLPALSGESGARSAR